MINQFNCGKYLCGSSDPLPSKILTYVIKIQLLFKICLKFAYPSIHSITLATPRLLTLAKNNKILIIVSQYIQFHQIQIHHLSLSIFAIVTSIQPLLLPNFWKQVDAGTYLPPVDRCVNILKKIFKISAHN